MSHELALAAALPAGVALALSAHGTVARATAIAFAASVVGMFGVSSLFHRVAWEPRAKLWLGRVDHTMIYALIAGTYTPITLLVLHPGWRPPILAIVWGGALLAIGAKFFWHGAPRWFAPVTCVALGGVALIALPQIFDAIGTAGALLLVGGGAFYTTGAVVYALRRPDPRPATFGYHEIFHSLVIAAVACQYATVAFYVLPRGMTVAVISTRGRQRLKVSAGIAFCVVLVAVSALVGRRLTGTSWPLQGTNVGLVLAAASAYLASFFFRALGWQRLFTGERPDRSRCLAACGAAAASGAVLPFRLDYAVKISTLRRLGGVRLGLETIGLSIISLGLVDAVAMLPLAIAAIVTSGAVFRAPLIVVLLFCLGCIGVLALGPRLVRLPFVSRSERVARIFTRVGDNAGFSRSMFVAGSFLFGCWTMRALGSTFLLSALGVGFSPTLALVVMCLAAAASILPITAGGAVVSIGATSGVLLGLGVPKDAAVNFSLASGMLLTGAALVAGGVGVGGSLLYTLQRRRLARATIA